MDLDEDLWQQCREITKAKPVKLPMLLGKIDGNRVVVVDGNEVKVRDDKPDDDPHMDFVEGGNDLEAAWVKREFGRHVLLIDAQLARGDWAFVLMHEAVERRLMEGGMSYPAAHKRANAVEKHLRMQARKE